MVEEDVYSVFSGSTAITAIVGSRIYPIIAPPESEYPMITYSRVAAWRSDHLGGRGNLERVTIEVSGWAATYREAKELGAYIDEAMAASTMTCTRASMMEEYIPDAAIFRVAQDYDIWAATT